MDLDPLSGNGKAVQEGLGGAGPWVVWLLRQAGRGRGRGYLVASEPGTEGTAEGTPEQGIAEIATSDLSAATSPIECAVNYIAGYRATKWLVTTVNPEWPVLQQHHTARLET